jgi:hypothetical protein
MNIGRYNIRDNDFHYKDTQRNNIYNVALRVKYTRNNSILHFVECQMYVEMLSVILPSVIMLNVMVPIKYHTLSVVLTSSIILFCACWQCKN